MSWAKPFGLQIALGWAYTPCEFGYPVTSMLRETDKNVQKSPSEPSLSPSRPPVLRLPETFAHRTLAPGMPYNLFFVGRTHILTFGAQKVVPQQENGQKLH